MKNLITGLYKTGNMDMNELKVLIDALKDSNNKDLRDYLMDCAYAVRKKYFGNSVYIRGLIEFSSICRMHCEYCGLRCENSHAQRYRISPEDIVSQCRRGYDFGYRTFVLQSGEDPWYTAEILTEMVGRIKEACPGAAVTLSIGERSRQEYEMLKAAGVDRFLLRHETANPDLYRALHPGMSFENRIRCLKDLKDLGFQTGSGFMVGLKGQTTEDLAMDLLLLKTLQVQMIGIGPFMPHQETPLGGEPHGNGQWTVMMIALARLLRPSALMPLTTALISLDRELLGDALYAGANVMMPNITPVVYKGQYALYNNKHAVEGLSEENMALLRLRLQNLGYTMDMGRGDAPC